MIKDEKETVSLMIRLYCRKRHGGEVLCEECQALEQYAMRRLDHCRFGDGKPTCQRCRVHCYKPEMRNRIAEVMRYSGPRMIWHHPMKALKHLIRR